MILRSLGIGLGALGASALVLGVLAPRAARRRSGAEEPGPADGVAFAGALIGAIALDVGLVLYLLGWPAAPDRTRGNDQVLGPSCRTLVKLPGESTARGDATRRSFRFHPRKGEEGF